MKVKLKRTFIGRYLESGKVVMVYIRVKRGKFKVEINKKGYPKVFKSFSTIKDAKKFT